MKLTNELIKFCVKNLRRLDAWRDDEDWDVCRRADGRWGILCEGLDKRLGVLGLPNSRGIRRYREGSLADIELVLRAIQKLADAGCLEALQQLSSFAMMAASSARNVERLIYVRDHPENLPWRRKPADQFADALASARAEAISDSEVNGMLRSVEEEIADAGPDADEADS